MTSKKLIVALAALFFSLHGYGQNFNQDSVRNFITKYKGIAMEEQIRTGVPAAITLAQGICETAAGTSALYTQAHNDFGIKCKGDWTGETYTYSDDQPNECFRKYDNNFQSFKDHSDFLKNSTRYSKLFELKPTQYKKWAKGLKKCGYATNKNYAQELIKYIDGYNLEQYTEQALTGDVLTEVQKSENKNNFLANSENTGNSSFTKDTSPEKVSSYNDAASPNFDTEKSTQYYVTTKKNGLKGFYARKGDLLLEYAITHRIHYGKLLSLNDLPDAPLEADMFIYLEKKRKAGLQPSFKVKPGMDLIQISQATGVDLEQLRILNHLKKGQEPAVGATLSLQQPLSEPVPLSQNDVTNENEKSINQYTQKSQSTYEQTQSDYVSLHHQPVAQSSPDTEQTKIQKSTNKVSSLQTTQPENSKLATDTFLTKKVPLKKIIPPETEAQQASIEKKQSDKELTPTEKLRAMMNKIVYGESSASENNDNETTSDKEEDMGNTVPKNTSQKPSPTEKLRAYMKTVKANRESEKESNNSLIIQNQVDEKANEIQNHENTTKQKFYTVKRGDTAYGIAKRFGITLKQLKEWNHLTASMAVPLGDRLKVAP